MASSPERENSRLDGNGPQISISSKMCWFHANSVKQISCKLTTHLEELIPRLGWTGLMKVNFFSNGHLDWDNHSRIGVCDKCLRWDIEEHLGSETHPLLWHDPPEGYPESELPSNGKIKPFKLCWKDLEDAILKARSMVIGSHWSFANAEVYLKTHCISPEYIKLLEKSIKNQMTANTYETNPRLSEDQKKNLRRHIQEHPHDYQLPPFPAAWRSGVPIDRFVDVIMHLLFLGVAKVKLLFKRIMLTFFFRILKHNCY